MAARCHVKRMMLTQAGGVHCRTTGLTTPPCISCACQQPRQRLPWQRAVRRGPPRPWSSCRGQQSGTGGQTGSAAQGAASCDTPPIACQTRTAARPCACWADPGPAAAGEHPAPCARAVPDLQPSCKIKTPGSAASLCTRPRHSRVIDSETCLHADTSVHADRQRHSWHARAGDAEAAG